MEIGDRVMVTRDDSPWKFGTIRKIQTDPLIGVHVLGKETTHFVEFDGVSCGAWFNPADLRGMAATDRSLS